MEIIFVSLIVVAGFAYVAHLHSKHVQKLEVLIKAQDLQDVKNYEKVEVEILKHEEPDSLQDAINGMEPEQIREMFNRSN